MLQHLVLLFFLGLNLLNNRYLVAAAPVYLGPQVKLDQGVFVGTKSGAVAKFLGIPYAVPP